MLWLDNRSVLYYPEMYKLYFSNFSGSILLYTDKKANQLPKPDVATRTDVDASRSDEKFSGNITKQVQLPFVYSSQIHQELDHRHSFNIN